MGLVDIKPDGEMLRTFAELTLALVLFKDAANTKLEVLKRNLDIPQRLLTIGLPSITRITRGSIRLRFRGLTWKGKSGRRATEWGKRLMKGVDTIWPGEASI